MAELRPAPSWRISINSPHCQIPARYLFPDRSQSVKKAAHTAFLRGQHFPLALRAPVREMLKRTKTLRVFIRSGVHAAGAGWAVKGFGP